MKIIEKPLSDDFATLVTREMGALFTASDFHASRTTDTSVVFQSDNAVEIEVYRDPYSFEIGLDVRWIMYPEEGYSMSEILRLWGHPEADVYRNFIASDSQSVTRGIQWLRRLLAELFDGGREFDESVRAALHRQQLGLARKMADDVRNKQARSAVATAWRQRDFRKMIKAMEGIHGNLTPLELQQLKYAKEQLRKPGSENN